MARSFIGRWRLSSHRNPTRKRGRTARRLFLEPLEPRHLMAVAISNADYPIEILPGGSTCSTDPALGIIDSQFNTITGVPAGPAFALCDSGFSDERVRYADGAVVVRQTDLGSAASGMPWGITRYWSNSEGFARWNVAGHGMIIAEQPLLVQVDGNDEISVITNGQTSLYFDKVGSDYEPRSFYQESLVHDSGNTKFTLTDSTGAVIEFYDFSTSLPVTQRGQFKSYTDAGGNVITASYNSTTGFIEEIQRANTVGSTTITESLLYAYITSGANDDLAESITLRRKENSGSWEIVRKVEYAYYGSSENHGSVGDLKTATIKDASNNTIDQTYYRYYKASQQDGYEHALKSVFYPASLARLIAAEGSSLDSIADVDAAPFADNYFEYDSDHRVVLQIAQGAGCSACAGGQGTFEYAYTTSNNDPGYNSWLTKTVETLPDGNENLVFTNSYGQVMLGMFHDTSESGMFSPLPVFEKHWGVFNRFDDAGRVILRADASAITNFDEELEDLLHYNAGNLQYVSDTGGLVTGFTYYASTTATTSTAGGVAGYLHEVFIQEGETGDEIPQSSQTYIERTAGGVTIFLPAASEVYTDDAGVDELTTSNAYTFFSGEVQVESIATTDPGGGVTTVFFDAFGLPVWTKDASGFIHYAEYDQRSGAVTKTIVDVDTAAVSNEPSGWTTPTGGGLHLVTTYEVDGLGRATMITDANGHITYSVFDDDSHEIRVYPGWNTTTDAPTGPTIVIREDRAGSYVERLTMSATPSLTSDEPNGSEAISSLQSLSRTFYSDGGQAVQTDVFFNLSGLTYTTSTSLGTEGTHFYRSTQGYDSRGRANRFERGDGTIYRTVFDGLGRPMSEWIGDDDTPASGDWSPDNPAGMIQVAGYEYDGGLVGDGHLTAVTDALSRQTAFAHDFRGRVTQTTLPDPGDGSPVFLTEYDNLNRVIETTDSLNNVTTILFDDANRDVTTTLPDPDGAGGASSPVLFSQFDVRGLLVSQTDALSETTSHEYDGAGRLIETTLPDPDGGGSAAAPVLGYEFDGVGNQITVIDGLGHETAYAFDRANRLTTITQQDPDAGGSLGAPVTTYAYTAAGWLASLTDPVSNVTSWTYDALGRVTGEENELTETRAFEYDAANRLIERTDRLGRVIQFDYNHFDQVIEERWYTSGMSLVRTLEFTFDDAGQMTEATDPAATLGFTYDDLGRISSESQSFAGFSPLITYDRAFNAMNSATEVSAAIGGTADFLNTLTYDNLQRVTQLTQQDQTGGNAVADKRIDFAYNARGQFTKISRYADLTTNEHVASSHYAYDDIGRLSRLTHSTSTTAPSSGFGSNALAGYFFTYDAASRITSIDSYVDGLTEYNHDNTNQLTAADHTGQTDESYSFDENGNRTMSGYSIGDNNQLLSDGTYDYEYDAEGNRSAKETIASGAREEYTWDHRNRLVTITFKNSGGTVIKTVDQLYDAFNQWVKRTVDPDGTTGSAALQDTYFSWLGGQIVAEFDGGSASDLTHRYLPNPAAVDHIFADEAVTSLSSAGTVLYPFADHLGTNRDLASYNATTNTTTIDNHRRYASFGVLISETNASIDHAFGFTGVYFDITIGLNYHRARWLDLDTGRWMSEDPISLNGDPSNIYRYVENQPTAGTDPSGLDGPFGPLTLPRPAPPLPTTIPGVPAPSPVPPVPRPAPGVPSAPPPVATGVLTFLGIVLTPTPLNVGSDVMPWQPGFRPPPGFKPRVPRIEFKLEKWVCTTKARGWAVGTPCHDLIFTGTGSSRQEAKDAAEGLCQAAGCHAPGRGGDCGHTRCRKLPN